MKQQNAGKIYNIAYEMFKPRYKNININKIPHEMKEVRKRQNNDTNMVTLKSAEYLTSNLVCICFFFSLSLSFRLSFLFFSSYALRFVRYSVAGAY